MPGSRLRSLAVALVAVSACTDTSSTTNLHPDGNPRIMQMRLTEEITTDMGVTYRPRRVFAFGSYPGATSDDEHAVTSAQAVNQSLRIIMSELLRGNNLEEIACRGQVDTDSYDRVPDGATPDDIAKCAVQNDVLSSSCTGDHLVCICHNDAGCTSGGKMIAKGQPVGVLDVNQDGAADDTRFIQGAVGIKCGSIDVPIDLDMSYWNPSGDQQVPAVGGFEALGPAIVLTPNGPLPTNMSCGLTFDPSVVDKQGNKVCATPDGSLATDCTPGDVSAVSFKTSALRLDHVSGLNDGDTGVARVMDVDAVFTAPLDATSVSTVTITENGNPFTAFTVMRGTMPEHVVIHPTAATGFGANAMYAITFPTTLTDTFRQGLPAAITFHFTTGP